MDEWQHTLRQVCNYNSMSKSKSIVVSVLKIHQELPITVLHDPYVHLQGMLFFLSKSE